MFSDRELKKHLSSKDYKNIYFVFGEEKFLVKHYTKLIEEKLSDNDLNDMNFHVITQDLKDASTGKTISNKSLLMNISNTVSTLPFMSSINIVELRDISIDAFNKDDFESFIKILSYTPDTTKVVITMPTLLFTSKDTNANLKKLIQFVDKEGICAEFTHKGELALEREICKWAKAGGSSMSELTASYLISSVGNDLNMLHSEMQKLTAFAFEEEITRETIDLVVHKNIDANIFDLFSFVIKGDTDKALNNLSTLFYQKVTPISIVINLYRTYRDAYISRVGLSCGQNIKDIAKDFEYKNMAWKLDKAKRLSGSVTTISLRRSIDELNDTYIDLITKSVNDTLEVEKLICKLSSFAKDRSDE